MKFSVLSIFPEILESYFSSSIMKRAVERKLVEYELVNIRDFTHDKHKTVDDAPYGGVAGQVMMAQPLSEALESVDSRKTYVVYASPSGELFSQKYAELLSEKEKIVFIAGRYEGIDERVISKYVDKELSLGDYVMSSGEVAVCAMIDSIYRLLPDVISKKSLEEESFTGGLLEYPLYTRPYEWKKLKVPDVLTNGNHKEIERWKMEQRIKKTLRNRPELIKTAREQNLLSKEEEEFLKRLTE